MNLADVTPVLITFNEERNIARTLSRLEWAKEIVVVDSGSTDRTLALLAEHQNVRVLHRSFDTHSRQWTFALRETGVTSEWVLALDADYQLPSGFVDELRALAPDAAVDGYWAKFKCCSLGQPLWGSLYPSSIVLYRRDRGIYEQDGHTQRLRVSGTALHLESVIYHDDRKPLDAWFPAQVRYARLEARKLQASAWRTLPLQDRVRKLRVIAPWLVLLYVLFVKGAILQGRPGLFYAFQRTTWELALSLYLFEDQAKVA